MISPYPSIGERISTSASAGGPTSMMKRIQDKAKPRRPVDRDRVTPERVNRE